MKNIERRGESYRGQVYSRGVRLSKTFRSESEAAAWVAGRKSAVAAGGRLERSPARRRRLDYGVITFSATRHADIATAEEIVALAKPRERICGVYFLISGGRIMYVGQSIDVHYRIGHHVNSLHRKFDSFHVVPCDEVRACLLESRYIAALQPPWNRGRSGALILSVHRGAIGIE